MLKNCLKPSRQHLHTVLNFVRGLHSLNRRHLDVVSHCGPGLYSLSQMNVSSLFFRSTEKAIEAAAKERAKKKKSSIRSLESIVSLTEGAPRVYFKSSSPSVPYHDLFARFGDSKIIFSDAVGVTSMYDTVSGTCLGMPQLITPKGPKSIAVSIRRTPEHVGMDFEVNGEFEGDFFRDEHQGLHLDSLYIMDMDCDSRYSSELLSFSPGSRWWSWRQLPAPPFLCSAAEYMAPDNIAFTVVGGTRICVSSDTATYLFDTVVREWSKVGDWVLPFHARAEYIPELGLWLGVLARSPYSMCALDLSDVSMGYCHNMPMVQCLSQDVDPPGEDCVLEHVALLNLGSGRLCIAKFFRVTLDRYHSKVVVLTGVEVGRCDDHQEGLFMIKHKSKHLTSDGIKCFL